jgi:serine protease AprX
VLRNRERLSIRVLNLSFNAPARSHYWDDPINQAVMRLWEAGIVVVASAGNTGPAPMTIGVPGNLPYVITVGAMTDLYTPEDRSDDRLTWFSAAAGPTHEGFVKPDPVVPGGHLRGVMPVDAYIPEEPSRVPRRRPLLRDVRDVAVRSGGQRHRRSDAAG